MFVVILSIGGASTILYASELEQTEAYEQTRTSDRGIELWFPHSTLKFSVSRRRRFQISMRRKILPPGGCVCTLHDNLGLATPTLFFK